MGWGNEGCPSGGVLIASAVSGEGKSSIAVSLAYSAVEVGCRNVLVDCDLRNSTITKELGLQGNAGLTDVLQGRVTLEDAIVAVDTLSVLPVGSSSLTPSDLLNSKQMKSLVKHLTDKYDLTLFDSPPLTEFIDARILSTLTESVVVVVKRGTTPKVLVEESLERLSRNCRIAGVILNQADIQNKPYHENG
jgi:capsular exopolysaccharide synthesis family protein